MNEEKKSGGRRIGRWILVGLGALLACGLISVIIGAISNSSDVADTGTVDGRTAEIAEGNATPAATTEERVAERTQDEPTLTLTIPPSPTATPQPTNTPAPTATPRPTNTPVPTPTPSPPPEPITLSGNGDDLVDLTDFNPEGIFGVEITGSGSGNFAVWNYDAQGDQIDLLVNEIGAYTGRHLLDIQDRQPPTAGFEVTASGPWTIEVFPFDPAYVENLRTPGTFSGRGDDFFVVLNEAGLNRASISHTGSSNFAVWVLNDGGLDLLVNEIGDYEGTVRVGAASTMLFMVTADGD